MICRFSGTREGSGSKAACASGVKFWWSFWSTSAPAAKMAFIIYKKQQVSWEDSERIETPKLPSILLKNIST